ncbi:MAG: XRE family transcriptional regulator [Clostridia bacterium]|nr:XRE family transcriptional regulator [Clostridia bacterium]MDY6185028.1 XRE family transcriptional regulator [Eubacteriales bacterium]
MTFGENLRQKRKACHLTLDTLASLVGTTRQTIYRYESGAIQSPPYDKVRTLAAVLGCTPAALLGWGVGDDLPASEEYGDYPVAVLTEGTDFCVTAPDRAMAGDRILEGDSVFIHRGSGIAYGHICALRLDGKTLLRRIYLAPAGDTLILLASDPAFAPILLSNTERSRMQYLGRAILFQSRL